MMVDDLTRHLDAIRSRYTASNAMLERALKRIPIGSQTFSKSHVQYPVGAAPMFLDRGRGSQVWDVDGNQYVDFVNGLLPVILGYCDPDVDQAVSAQLTKGVSFTLPTSLEIELAELLAEIIPCAEMSRFFKNGSDATSGAIRVARSHTGRDRVAVCGYHGWQDWYIGSTLRNKGVPTVTRNLTSVFTYNDIDSLHRVLNDHPDEFAAVIMEPMNVTDPKPGFLAECRELAHRHGALFVFDEVITGFRFHLGGAQTLYGVEPDLASFGKSMGNGYPISALVGKAEYMQQMEEVFLSGTFGGEALSLTASIATIQKMRREPVHQRLADSGQQIKDSAQARIERHGLQHCLSVSGHPTWSFINFRDTPQATLWEIKTLYLQEVLALGVLTLGTHNLSYSHSASDLVKLADAQDVAFGRIREALDSPNFADYLAGAPLVPLFRVR